MADDIAYSQSRIAKNTIILGLRMLFTMAITLYTSRAVLAVLGIEDYGLYNIIGGVVILLSVVSNSMTNATQRFITFELGKNNPQRVSEVFSMSLIAHGLICLAFILLGESLGLWYVNTQLNIPSGRENAAHIIYQFSLFSVVVNLIRSPYNASVIAHERMSFFAYMSILEVILKLAIVYVLIIVPYDKLVFYALLILLANIVILQSYTFFCVRKFETCHFKFRIEKDYFKDLFDYLGWNLLGASASLGTQQAGNLIINRFLGVAVNAAFGVANQVYGAINGFVSSFQTAFTPQIVKLYSQQRMEEFYSLSNRAAIMSFYLLFLVAFPLVLRMDDVLSIWLVDVPVYASSFCILLVVYSLIDTLQAPFWIGINATGNIKHYEIWLSLVLLLNIPFSIWALRMGMAAYWVLAIRVALNFITAIIRCVHVKIQLRFPIGTYLKDVVARAVLVLLVTYILWIVIPHNGFADSLIGFVLYYFVSVIIISGIIWLIGMNKIEREGLVSIVKQVVSGSRNTKNEG